MKQVLLTYLDHNKVVKIPDEAHETDVVYLKNQFRKLFAYENHVVVNIALQRFDSDWNAFIDMDDDEAVCDRDTLKVIVTPMLSTPSASESSERVSPHYISRQGWSQVH